MWLALVLAYFVAFSWQLFPVSGAYDFSLQPEWSWEFARSFASHWFLPFLSLFLVSFGGWAIGMRNLIIYELEADYANYLQSLGAPSRLVRSYAYRNAVLPQMSGLALALGAVVGGALVTEVVFGYPGVGSLILTAVQNQRLLPAPGRLPVHHRRRPDRELHRRHPLHRRRPAHARRDPGAVVSTLEPVVEQLEAPVRRGRAARTPPVRRRREWLYFALRNTQAHDRVPGRRVRPASLAVVGPWLDGRRPVRVRVRHRAAAVGGATGWARPPPARTCSRSSSTACARASSSARSAPRSRSIIGDGGRVHRGLQGRRRRRGPEHVHERRARDPDARRPDHRLRVPERPRARQRGDPDRRDLVALGGARDPRADVLARVARLRQPRAALRRARDDT